MHNENDFKPKRKPHFLVELFAWVILYGPFLILVYFSTLAVGSCIRHIS